MSPFDLNTRTASGLDKRTPCDPSPLRVDAIAGSITED
jgi:hypothetical protein